MSVQLLQGDCREVLPTLPAESAHAVVTSPPYWALRSYLRDDHPDKGRELGQEATPEDYVANLVAVFREVRRVLRHDGVAWLNLGDSFCSSAVQGDRGKRFGSPKHAAGALGLYSGPNRRPVPGLKPKDLVGIPWRAALALQADGWFLRADVVWSKRNAMPESCDDRPPRSHEYLFLLARSRRYFFDPTGEGTAPEGGRWRTVWEIPTRPFHGAHFAVMPPALAARCILTGCPPGGTVLDPFGGSGTTGEVATTLGRRSILIELNPDFLPIAGRRTAQQGLFVA